MKIIEISEIFEITVILETSAVFFSSDLEVWFFANIPNFIVENDFEIKIGCYRGSGGDLFFLGF